MRKATPCRSARKRFPSPASSRDRAAVGGGQDGLLIPSSSRSSSSSSTSSSPGGEGDGAVKQMVAENPVVVVAQRGCCMCHAARRLLLGLGVNPAVCEVGEEAAAAGEATALVEAAAEIEALGGQRRPPVILPVVFVGGRLLGGLDRLVAVHITGELVPILKEAGALWL
ncbi:Glutaredoxin [Musa troglodytarum]|uniref:Glutaredoxin n=1 Tax=Musa troglodytarum TaxID=320322 RepID=A0A9E7EED5_9LILI|nr:Glutaredoxin [Musa troglodytarum]